jgi:predicted metalloprotease with PDZ domain
MSIRRQGIRALLLPSLLLLLSVDSAVAADLLRYTIRFEPFEVELTLPDGSTQKRSLPRQPTYFLHRANNRWPIPEGPANKQIQCEVRWIGLPPDWRLITSFGINRRVERFETTLGGLRKAVFAAGDFRTARSTKGIVLAIRGDWKQSDSEFLTMADRITEPLTKLWRDRGLGEHRVFVLPQPRNNWGGEGRTHGLVMEGNPETFEPSVFAQLLSHEFLHEWNPRRLHFTDDETLYWFTEGFTDYYSVAALWRAGIWSFEQVLTYSNNVARGYYTSPMRNLTPDWMVALRQSDPSANRLPYQQGYLLAARWNSKGQMLDVAMRNLLADGAEPLSNARIAKALRSVGIENAELEIARFVTEGNTIEPRAGVWGTCATEMQKDFRRFDMGFDDKASEKDMIIRGTKRDSNAWAAGVRDGLKWRPRDVVFGDPSYLAGIEIEDEQGKRLIQYHPASTKAFSVPQYKANAPNCDPWTFTPLSGSR